MDHLYRFTLLFDKVQNCFPQLLLRVLNFLAVDVRNGAVECFKVDGEFMRFEDPFLAGEVSDVCGKEMVCYLIELLDAFDMDANNSFLLFEYTDGAIDLDVAELLVIEVTESLRKLVLVFVVEEDVESASIVVDFKLGTHGLLYATEESPTDDDVINWVTFEFANVI